VLGDAGVGQRLAEPMTAAFFAHPLPGVDSSNGPFWNATLALLTVETQRCIVVVSFSLSASIS
jgi:hypothetical protein